jgi:HEPN domain-containing protein
MNGRELAAEARRWLRFAHEDLVGAEQLLASGSFLPRHACWLAQQAAEKAIKAALVLEGIDFPFRHDLDALRNLLPDRWPVKREHPDLAELTEWAVHARYPGDWYEVTDGDAKRAVQEARAVYESVTAEFVHRGVHLTHIEEA